jgi:hypothetical protein
MKGIAPEPSAYYSEDPSRVRNRANHERLERISAALLERAIGVMKTATQEDFERLRIRCANWHGEKDAVIAFLHSNVDPDNWELVRFAEPWIEEKGPQYWPFVPAIRDSPNDTWPTEKWELWNFVNANVSEANRHLVKLLNPEDLSARKEKSRAKVIR